MISHFLLTFFALRSYYWSSQQSASSLLDISLWISDIDTYPASFCLPIREREIYVDQKSIIDCGQIIIGAAVNNSGLYREFSGISSSCFQQDLSCYVLNVYKCKWNTSVLFAHHFAIKREFLFRSLRGRSWAVCRAGLIILARRYGCRSDSGRSAIGE